MSIAYAHYLIPNTSDLDYVATADAVERLIRELQIAKWLDMASDAVRLEEYEGANRTKRSVSISELGSAITDALAAGRQAVVHLTLREADAPASEAFGAMPSGTPLGCAQCWAAQIVLCQRLCTPIQDSEGSVRLLCPSCGNDLFVALKTTGAPWDDIGYEFEGVLDHCTQCGNVASPAAIHGQSMSAIDGSMRDEAAPLFRVALRLYSDAPPDDPAVTDPAVLKALEAATGKAFRAVGRWC